MRENSGGRWNLAEYWTVSGYSGKQDAKNGSFANFTLDFDSPMMSFDDSFALEHSDAYAFVFSRLEGSKEGMMNKIGSHAAAVVAH